MIADRLWKKNGKGKGDHKLNQHNRTRNIVSEMRKKKQMDNMGAEIRSEMCEGYPCALLSESFTSNQ